MSKDQWILEHGMIVDDYINDIDNGVSEDEALARARSRLRALGFNSEEIEDELAGVLE